MLHLEVCPGEEGRAEGGRGGGGRGGGRAVVVSALHLPCPALTPAPYRGRGRGRGLALGVRTEARGCFIATLIVSEPLVVGVGVWGDGCEGRGVGRGVAGGRVWGFRRWKGGGGYAGRS